MFTDTVPTMTMLERLIEQLKTNNLTQAEFYSSIDVSKQVWNGWKKRGTIPAARLEVIKRKYPLFDITYITTGTTGSSISIAGLISQASPRSKAALEHINQAVEQGKLSDDDVELLQKIAKRMQHD